MSICSRIRDAIAEFSWAGLFGLEDRSGLLGRPAATGQIGFTIAVIALGAKMAKADGAVTASEIDAFHEVFQADPHERENVDFFFNLARRSTAGAETYARQIFRLLNGDRLVLEDVLGALFHIARADGRFTPAEDAYLQRIAGIFGFAPDEYRRIRGYHIGREHIGSEHTALLEDDPWQILGLPADSPATAIKSRWRQLVQATHPDRALAQGLPAEFVAIATTKLARINAAYDKIMAGLRQSGPTPDEEMV